MQLGFVIDHSRCIGCHACTVACKSENDVPLGSFRTWVKYTERGSFPEVRRSFAVLRCNQCTAAPCVEICPVRALEKRPDGIVDVDPERCIGCKGCMQACPYDALYVNPRHGTVEKCHFCAHRTEQGLAPACAVVCPTEAIVPGDFHDPDSEVSRLKAAGGLDARKPEAGTGPNVFYRDVDPAGVRPMTTNSAGGFLWANQTPGPRLDAQFFESTAEIEHRAEARTVYDVDHEICWGGRVSAYLLTKSIAAGAALAAIPLALERSGQLWAASISMLFLLVTTVLLVADLKRPERFLYILRYANWDSWLARGTLVLGGYGAALTLWLIAAWFDFDTRLITFITIPFAALTAMYTAWLFAQAKGRVLWMRRGLGFSLLLHAAIAGAACWVLLGPLIGVDAASGAVLRQVLVALLVVELGAKFAEGALAPAQREQEYRRAHRLVTHGPYAGRRWWLAIGAGTVLPALLLFLPVGPLGLLGSIAALLALLGLLAEQDILVRAGQAPAIS